ncbi:hypothetical protein FNV43_RR02221 [Rhamnella rubrinervis]|uniref:Uncharacterized protein n=1 Tax=Rhamnella rubrinervis TaxID=2594499 RepID=A0A8K0HSS4_9ROSA|nr:hypothetical protein FNV43_RR02221 [Rhamnella rubrinervis]
MQHGCGLVCSWLFFTLSYQLKSSTRSAAGSRDLQVFPSLCGARDAGVLRIGAPRSGFFRWIEIGWRCVDMAGFEIFGFGESAGFVWAWFVLSGWRGVVHLLRSRWALARGEMVGSGVNHFGATGSRCISAILIVELGRGSFLNLAWSGLSLSRWIAGLASQGGFLVIFTGGRLLFLELSESSSPAVGGLRWGSEAAIGLPPIILGAYAGTIQEAVISFVYGSVFQEVEKSRTALGHLCRFYDHQVSYLLILVELSSLGCGTRGEASLGVGIGICLVIFTTKSLWLRKNFFRSKHYWQGLEEIIGKATFEFLDEARFLKLSWDRCRVEWLRGGDRDSILDSVDKFVDHVRKLPFQGVRKVIHFLHFYWYCQDFLVFISDGLRVSPADFLPGTPLPDSPHITDDVLMFREGLIEFDGVLMPCLYVLVGINLDKSHIYFGSVSQSRRRQDFGGLESRRLLSISGSPFKSPTLFFHPIGFWAVSLLKGRTLRWRSVVLD